MSSNPSYITPAERLKLFAQQWETLKWALMCELRVASPAIVQSFDAVKQTVTVKLSVNENLVIAGKITPTAIDTLVDVPILIPRAGGFAITFPVAVGDECLVVFGDNCMNSWWQNGGADNVQETRRRHDVSDAFAIFGPTSQPKRLASYVSNALQIRNEDGSVFIEVSATDVNIFVPGGNVVINGGTVNIGTDTTIDGKNFLTHVHSGVQTGGGTSGPVV